MNAVALIPARGGSKRLPGKNLVDFGGKPLITHTCEAALAAGGFDAIYANTDDADIARVAEAAGVECPVLRPAELARDETPTEASNRFLLKYLADRGETYDTVVTLQPTSPLRTADDIRAALLKYEEYAPCAVVSVTRVAPASWLGSLGRDGHFEPLPGDAPVFRLNGAIYVHTWDDYLTGQRPQRTMVCVMPPERGVDIDTWDDLHYAASLLRNTAQTARAG